MAYDDVEILRDKNGNPIPQYYNVATGQFEPLTGENGATHTQLTGRNVLLRSVTGVNVSAGSSFIAIQPTDAENISGLYVLVRSDSYHKYRVRVDHHRETGSTLPKFSGDTDALPLAERTFGVSEIIKPVGYRFGIIIYNEDTRDHIYDVEVRSE